MGCGASKSLAKSARLKEEVHTPSRKTLTEFDEILAYTNGTDQQFITLLCTSPNIVPKKLHDKKSPQSFNPTIADEAQESENDIETINAWELLAGLEEDDDNEVEEVEAKKKEISSKNLNSIAMKVEELKREGEIEKGLRRKIMAAELCTRRVATFQITRTASLRDWLMQGGQGKANGSAVKPEFGGLEKKVAGEVGRDCEENVFDPVLVAQLEKAMEDLTSEEEEILKQIMDSWEGNVRKVF
ncbi:hypothetical protein KSP40_PGU000951 [Platanthera guangdongensis]|uniref:Uncharacterized protein n=1 Tax=Platanthera guangdongensis TaxID=2320717 RepID=A0ABR2LTI0_9ASPA